jgi:hypothetical protein
LDDELDRVGSRGSSSPRLSPSTRPMILEIERPTLYRSHLTGTLYHCIHTQIDPTTMSNSLGRPLSPIIESPPTTPQKQPSCDPKHQHPQHPPHHLDANTTDVHTVTTTPTPALGFHSLSPPPASLKNPKSVTWGDLIAYRTIGTRADDVDADALGYRSPDTEVSLFFSTSSFLVSLAWVYSRGDREKLMLVCFVWMVRVL